MRSFEEIIRAMPEAQMPRACYKLPTDKMMCVHCGKETHMLAGYISALPVVCGTCLVRMGAT